ncbi:MAG: serine hydrolase domain-containing protein [Phycisphaerales bacterium]|jgi:CubicO group peptidase (beta-lactamase class C family)
MHRPLACLACLASVAVVAPALAQDLPSRGRVVPQLAELDRLMQDTMTDNGITAGVLAVAFDDRVVYQRSFGWLDRARTTPLPMNAELRLASVSKPITAAIVRNLISDGMLSAGDKAFDVGQPGGGILPIDPFPSLGDPRIGDITIANLLQHRGGWNRDLVGNHAFRDVQIASEMGVPSPPGPMNKMRWILGQPLEFSPGTQYAYANIGYHALGLIIEQVTGNTYEQEVERLFDDLGHPGAVRVGRTFAADQGPLEPWYDQEDIGFAQNVFDPTGPFVRWPYGGWDHEGSASFGGLIASGEPLLALADAYILFGGSSGVVLPGGVGPTFLSAHSGSLPGTDTVVWQRGQGLRVAVLFNHRDQTFGSAWGVDVAAEIDRMVQAGEIAEPPCAADLDADGSLTIFDFLAFQNRFDAGSLETDFDGDGALTIFDFLAFQNAFDLGCS